MAASEIGADAAKRRNMPTFRLSTLLLLPLVVGLFHSYADQVFDRFLLLLVGVAALFGSRSAVDRMKRIGLRKQGLRRLFSVAWSALWVGATVGLLSGSVAFVLAVARSDRSWWRSVTRDLPWEDQVFELGTAILAGASLGIFFGACGSLLLGLPAAYYFNRSFRQRQATSTVMDTAVVERMSATRRWLRFVLIGIFSLILATPPIWFAWQVHMYHREQELVAIMREDLPSSIVEQVSKFVGPRWSLKLLETSYRVPHLHRVDQLLIQELDGVLKAEHWHGIQRMTHLELLFLDPPNTTDSQLEQIADELNQCAAKEVILDVRESRGTHRGLKALSGVPKLTGLLLSGTFVTEDTLPTLRAMKRLERNLVIDVTDGSAVDTATLEKTLPPARIMDYRAPK